MSEKKKVRSSDDVSNCFGLRWGCAEAEFLGTLWHHTRCVRIRFYVKHFPHILSQISSTSTLSHTKKMSLTRLSIFGKAVFDFVVHCSTLKPANFNLRVGQTKVTHLCNFIHFIIENISVNTTIKLKTVWPNRANFPRGEFGVAFTLRHNDTPVVDAKENI